MESLKVRDPLMQSYKQTEYLIVEDETSGEKTAYVEVANSAGLQMVKKEDRDPNIACSIGIGELIRHCYEKERVKRVVVGSGGSAFVDGGFWCMTSGLKAFKAFMKEGEEINTDKIKPS